MTDADVEIHNKDISLPDTSKEIPEPMVSVHANLPELDLSKLPENEVKMNDEKVQKESSVDSRSLKEKDSTVENETNEAKRKGDDDTTNSNINIRDKDNGSSKKTTEENDSGQATELERDKDRCNSENETPSTSSVVIKSEIKEEPPELLGSAKEQEEEGEEWCAVCHDGGDLLYCCDRCPKVYHLYCYIPPLKEEPPDDWVTQN